MDVTMMTPHTNNAVFVGVHANDLACTMSTQNGQGLGVIRVKLENL